MRARAVLIIGVLALAVMSVKFAPRVSADNTLPHVELNANNLGPRPIEDLTHQVVARDYANAWQTMAEALKQNRRDLLDGYYTGLAKEKLTKLIADQVKTGVRIEYTDHGHTLEGLFYAPGGDAMQLRDRARLEIQIMDGDKVIHSEQVSQSYMVLMTPGADRWLIRDLETISEAAR